MVSAFRSLIAYSDGNSKGSSKLRLFLGVTDGPNVRSGWSQHANLYCTIVNKNSRKVSQLLGEYYFYSSQLIRFSFNLLWDSGCYKIPVNL